MFKPGSSIAYVRETRKYVCTCVNWQEQSTYVNNGL